MLPLVRGLRGASDSARAAVVDARTLDGHLDLDVDAVVVGTGAGGGVAFRELARAGLNVVALEEGGHHQPQDFTQREEAMFAMLFQERGGRSTDDLGIRVLQGRGVGGSTVHNTNLCKRIPDPILEGWARDYGVVGLGPADMRPSFEAIERDLSVSLIAPEMRNRNNEALRRGVEALGWRGATLHHNREGCVGSGFCELGCAYDAKQGALKILIPQGLAAGGRVYANVRVARVDFAAGRVLGVSGAVVDEAGEPLHAVRIRAKVVVLAASATGSAALVRASGIPGEGAGKSLRLHPGAVVAGLFDEPIEGHRGIPQSYECTELLSFEPGSDKRVWITTAFAHPIATAAMLPGFGAAHMRAMRQYPRLAVFTAMVHDETKGEVSVGPGGRPKIHYEMNEGDRVQLARGLAACARLMLAAGAREAIVPATRPVTLRTDADIAATDWRFVRAHGVPITAVHPMGSLPMGEDARRAVVDSTGEHHHVRGLFVADGSLFPTSIGGPPQIGIYALSLHLMPHVIARARG